MDPRTAKTPLFTAAGLPWIGILVAPIAWALDEEISYALAGWSCQNRYTLISYLVTVMALAAIASAAIFSWREWSRLGTGDRSQNQPPARGRFAALGGLGISLLFGLVVLVDAAAKFWFDPCQR